MIRLGQATGVSTTGDIPPGEWMNIERIMQTLAGVRMADGNDKSAWDKFMEFNNSTLPIAAQVFQTYMGYRTQTQSAKILMDGLYKTQPQAGQNMTTAAVSNQLFQQAGAPVNPQQSQASSAIIQALMGMPGGQQAINQAGASLIQQAQATGDDAAVAALFQRFQQQQQQQKEAGNWDTVKKWALPVSLAGLGLGLAIFIARPKEIEAPGLRVRA